MRRIFPGKVHKILNALLINFQLSDKMIQTKITGVATFDGEHFFFAPDDSNINSVENRELVGKSIQLSDGSYEFHPIDRNHRSRAKLIKKLTHGRASETIDGFISLTIKVSVKEDICISETIREEALIAVRAIRNYQVLKGF